MIGNDVVDLLDPEVRPGAAHPRFDRRVFAPEEREVLGLSGAPERLRWMLWAAKEAAYKVARKLAPRVVFSPRRFVVRLDPRLRGEVAHGVRRYAVRLEEGAGRVHALASEGPLPDAEGAELATGWLELAPDDPRAGEVVRAAALRALGARLGTAPGELAFVREGRIPRLHLRGEPAPFDVSLSHHGRFAAFAAVPARAPAAEPAAALEVLPR